MKKKIKIMLAISYSNVKELKNKICKDSNKKTGIYM